MDKGKDYSKFINNNVTEKQLKKYVEFISELSREIILEEVRKYKESIRKNIAYPQVDT